MIAAIVLAAGLSRRMGRFKLLLPWGATTVLGQVVATLKAAGVGQIIVVTGHRADEIAAEVEGSGARTVVNPDYASGEMLSSIRAGIRALIPPGQQEAQDLPRAALLCLGDQPQMEAVTVQRVLETAGALGWNTTVIPSYRMRAGHPILLPRGLWPEILDCPDTLRTVLAAHRDQTHYLDVDTPTVLADLDTPEDYAAGHRQQDAGSR
jgi:molybdenum cofactor cytidylyltransferase